MVEAEISLPFYEHVLDFLANGPSPQETIDFRPSADVLSCFSELLEANRERDLHITGTGRTRPLYSN
jgi:hypothetical protein